MFAGGYWNTNIFKRNKIIEIPLQLGNATDFGDLSQVSAKGGGLVQHRGRGLFAGRIAISSIT